MNSSDQIQARHDEIARWKKELAEARDAYAKARDALHIPGKLLDELDAVRSASTRIEDAKFKLEWLQWCDQTDEERARYEADVHS